MHQQQAGRMVYVAMSVTATFSTSSYRELYLATYIIIVIALATCKLIYVYHSSYIHAVTYTRVT